MNGLRLVDQQLELIPYGAQAERILSTNLPEVVCVILVRFAVNPASLRLPPPIAVRCTPSKWTAARVPGEYQVTLILQEGPLARCILTFRAQAEARGEYSFWLQGGYQPRTAALYGILEDWRTKRTAAALREGVVAMLRYSVAQVGQRDGLRVRQAERRPLPGTMRLRIGTRSWMGKLLNVSEGGLGGAIACRDDEAAALLHYLSTAHEGELDLIEPQQAEPILVTTRHVSRVPGGLAVGLQARRPQQLAPLLQLAVRRAALQAKPQPGS